MLTITHRRTITYGALTRSVFSILTQQSYSRHFNVHMCSVHHLDIVCAHQQGDMVLMKRQNVQILPQPQLMQQRHIHNCGRNSVTLITAAHLCGSTQLEGTSLSRIRKSGGQENVTTMANSEDASISSCFYVMMLFNAPRFHAA